MFQFFFTLITVDYVCQFTCELNYFNYIAVLKLILVNYFLLHQNDKMFKILLFPENLF